MTTTISENAKAVLALAEEKERLQALALELNAHTRKLTDEFHRMLNETSDQQKDILEKIASLDATIAGCIRTPGLLY